MTAERGAFIRSICVAALAAALVACTTGAAIPSAGPSTIASASAAASPSAGGTSGPSGVAGLRLIVLGDSIAGGGEGSDGSSFGAPLAAAIEGLAGSPVEVLVRADPSETSTSLLKRVQTRTTIRDELAGAGIITITVGGNDGDPFAAYPEGTCSVGGDAAACLAAYAPTLEADLDAILHELLLLRSGEPTAIRITSPDYNALIGLQPSADLPSFEPDLGLTFYRQVVEAETAAACRAAERVGAVCVDLSQAFNGDGTKDAGELLAADHLHPSAAGQQRIADLIVESGFAPVLAAPK